MALQLVTAACSNARLIALRARTERSYRFVKDTAASSSFQIVRSLMAHALHVKMRCNCIVKR